MFTHPLLAIYSACSPLSALQESAPGVEAPAPTSGFDFLFPTILILGIFYFLLIRPERKQRKKREAMLGSLKKGDKVMTTSGMHGTVAQIRDDVVHLQVAEGVRLRFSRQAIQAALDDGDSDSGD